MRGENRGHPGARHGSVVVRLARQQHGLVSRRQLLALGVERHAIDRRVAARRLTPVRRGIYRLGPIPQPLERQMAAALAFPDAVLSHRSAAALHGLLPDPPGSGRVHVTVTGSDRGRSPGLRIHRTSRLPADERTRRHRIPVTTEARTALDLAPELRPHQLEQLLAMASPRPIHALITRYPRRPGIPALRAALQEAPKLTRSRAERRILSAIRRAELPEPQTNVELAGYEVDFLWAEPHLVVEVDGHPFHSARPDRRRDLRRDARLGELGYAVLRLDADESGERAIALIAGALARATR